MKRVTSLVGVLTLCLGAVSSIAATPAILTGPVTNTANGHVYYLLEGANWTDSEAKAVELGGHLTAISDAAEDAWVFNNFGNVGGTPRGLWIGLNDTNQEGSFVWVDGDGSTYRNWAGGEPNNFNNEDHAFIFAPQDTRAGTWNDSPADVTLATFAGPNYPASFPLHGVVEVAPPGCVLPPAGMISWWPGDGDAVDIAGGNSGTLVNGAGFVSSKVGQAFALDGANDYVSVPDNPLWDFGSDDFSIELWTSFDTVKSLNVFVAHDPGPGVQNKWAFWLNGGQLQFHLNGTGIGGPQGNGILVGSAPFAPVTGQYYHVAVTRASDVFTFYVDGVTAGMATNAQAVLYAPASLTLGQAEGVGHLDGTMDELSIYNRALSTAEIQAVHAVNSAGKCALSGAPVLTQQPQSQAVLVGADVTFVSSAVGNNYLAYQWFLGLAPLPGQTNPMLNLSNVQLLDAGDYTVVVTNNFGSVTSAVATLTVTTLPPILTGPVTNPANGHLYYLLGGATWTASEARAQELGAHLATINDPAEDAWVFNTFGNVGGTPRGLWIGLNDTNQEGSFVWVDGDGSTYRNWAGGEPNNFNNEDHAFIFAPQDTRAGTWNDSPADVTLATFAGPNYPASFPLHGVVEVIPPYPLITQQPQNQSVLAGENAIFSVQATGDAPLAYQWYRGVTPQAGQTNAVLNLVGVQPANAGVYLVVIANSFGSVTSQVATLSVTLPPARVQVTSITTNALGPVSVPVVLVANGNEAATGFSFEFNPALLTYTGVTLGSGAPGGSLLVNASQAASGRVGIAVSLPAGTFAAGTQQVATVNFTIAPVASDTNAALTLGDTPIVREVANSLGQPLPAEFLAGAVSIVAVDYEGDVTPRPTGNRSLTVSDWVQVGRFVAGLDTPATDGEFQRADTAPRGNRGNGNLSATDWVQAGRYAAGLDPVTAAGGPTGGGGSAVSAGKAASSGGTRDFRVTNTNLTAGRTGTVDIELNAAGDESAATFSLTYDAAQMSFTGATLGTGATGGTLNVNTSQAGAGKVGLAVSLPIGSTLAAGPQQVVRASFLLLQTASGDSPLAFGSTPVLQEVSDPLANALAASYSDALLKIEGPIPTLTISQNGDAVVLMWPSDIAGYAVEESPTMLLPAAWNAVAAPPSVIGSSNVVVLPATNEVRFFRLRK